MTGTNKSRGHNRKHKDRGPVKLQPKPKPTRLKRGDDDLLAKAVTRDVKKKAAARKASPSRKKAARKQSKAA